MDVIGLRELRQQASDLVRRVEAGEEITITVAGRPSARLVPTAPSRWRTWADVAELYDGSGSVDWEASRDLLDHDINDPWDRR